VDVLTVDTRRGWRVRSRNEDGSWAYLAPQLLEFQSVAVSLRFPDAFGRLIRRYDVLHFHYPNPIGEISQLLFGLLTHVPAIATFHGEAVRHRAFSRLYDPMARLFFRRMDRIVATSPNMLESARILQPFKDKATVIPLGIPVPAPELDDDPSPFSPLPFSPSPFPKGTYPKILYVGRLSRYKGVPHLIEAMRNAPGHLLVVGDGPLRAALDAQSRGTGIAGRVSFTGFVPDAELGNAYRSADIFVLPSTDRAEGFGYVLLEAMAASLPMVSTDLGTGTSFVNQHGATGLVVPPADPHALAEAIRSLAEDPELMRRFGQQARARLQELFIVEGMANAIEAEYYTLVGTRDKPRAGP
jgi:rhamnosyl/mannosyltransferase